MELCKGVISCGVPGYYNTVYFQVTEKLPVIGIVREKTSEHDFLECLLVP